MTLENRRRATWLGLFLLGVIAGVVLSLRHFAHISLPGWAGLSLLVVVLVIGGVTTVSWWRLLDEVAREAHKFAWYWGGSAGILFAGILTALVEAGKIQAPLLMGPSISDAFSAGGVTVLLSQVAGYTVAWVGWWWSRR